MKKFFRSVSLCFVTILLKAQLPTIYATTIVPQAPSSTSNVKIVTHVTTPNQGILVDITHTVTNNPKEIKLTTCYWQGMLPTIQTHIDTFVVGQLQAGVYTIKHKAYMSTTQQHCTKVDSNMVVSTLTVGGITTDIKSIEQNSFLVYPNPVKDKLYFKVNEKYSETEIYNLDGRLVKIAKVDEQGSLNVTSLSKGIYFLQFPNQPRGSVIKFIKE